MNKDIKILIVDDFSTMRRIIRNMLKQLGYTHVVEAENGAQALKELTTGSNFQLVLTDWNMPVMDGLQLLTEIRNSPNLANLPVLMITAETKREQILHAAKSGVNGYLIKPFTAPALQEKIEKILARLKVAA
ncbi:MAG: response regulator receiver protein [Osedax symbiont Rs2]|nr:MAG: response regulator receiver protein [Osedax symbiont Rs2]